MSSLSQFVGGQSTTNIVNYYSSGSVISAAISEANANAKKLTAGSLTAGVLAQSLSITGAGEISFLAVTSDDTTSRTVRAKITVDGVVVFDATSSATTTANTGLVVVGSVASAAYFVHINPIIFRTSLLVEVASSLTETGGVNTVYSLNSK